MKPHATSINQRLLRGQAPSYERLQARLAEDGSQLGAAPIAVHCGWGRLLIGHTFADAASLAQELLNEQPGERDIALYVAAPQQVLGLEPTQLFLDPSDTLRLWFSDYRPAQRVFRGFRIRRAQSEGDWTAINNLYIARGMLPIDPHLLTPRHLGGPVYWLAEDEDSGAIIGSAKPTTPSASAAASSTMPTIDDTESFEPLLINECVVCLLFIASALCVID